MARRALPLLLSIPLVIGYFRFMGEKTGLIDAEMGNSLMILVSIALTCFVFWWGLSAIRHRDIAHQKAEEAQQAVALEIRKREDALRETEARTLREADRNKNEFLAVLAHEFRNSLAPMVNALEIIKRAEIDDVSIGRSRVILERQLHHLSRLLEDLLDISRIARNRLELRFETVQMRTILEGILETWRPLIGAAGLELIVQKGEGPMTVHADPARLTQILGNLLANACRYSNPGGKIYIASRCEGNEVVITVQDEGIGIKADMLERIFETFVQIDGGSERSQKGLGIGLALVKRLVELHRGSVAATSEGPGRGSQFTVRLPVVPAPEVAQVIELSSA